MKKLLLHMCCAPCVTVPLTRLKTEFEITGFFYNPNIHPENEYKIRLDELRSYLDQLDVELIVGEYDTKRWFELVRGLENEPEGGKRCEICFKMRLDRTAKFAKNHNIDFFTTVMSISPHKNAALLNEVGKEFGLKYGVQFFEANFKKKDGFKQSVMLSRQHNMYRQNYCGCVFSQKTTDQRGDSK